MHRIPICRRRFMVLAAAAAGCRPSSPSSPPSADDAAATVVLRNGTILTMDPDQPRTDALAIRDGVIVALGDEALARVGPATDVRDLEGGTATAGLVDAHGHLIGLGQSLEQVDLRGARSIDEVVARLREQAPPSGWIQGRGWDQNLWQGGQMPTHHALSEAFPDRPVWLRRVDGHAGWANAALLEFAELAPSTEVPVGGEILRDDKGQPTGVLVDAAMSLVRPPAPSESELARFIERGQAHALSRGLTGLHEMGLNAAGDAAYRRLGDGLKMRIHGYASANWFEDATPDVLEPSTMYALVGVKVFADGALGSRGAALLAPYSDRAEHVGLMQYEPDAFADLVANAVRGGFQVATHAIGDAAIRAVLDAYEHAPERASGVPRLRIEHCQIMHPADIPRFAKLGVIASMQPVHATSDMAWVPSRIGPDRVQGAYAWRSFLDAGANLCFGSDVPVELIDVTHGIHAAMTRQDANGEPAGGWLPEQRLSLRETLEAFSSGAAFAVHREDHLGMLRAGFRGDVTCFVDDLESLDPTAIRDAGIKGTIVDGRIQGWS